MDKNILIKFVKDTYCVVTNEYVYLYKPDTKYLDEFIKCYNITDITIDKINDSENKSNNLSNSKNKYNIYFVNKLTSIKNDIEKYAELCPLLNESNNIDINYKVKNFQSWFIIPVEHADWFIYEIFMHIYFELCNLLKENIKKDKIILQNRDKEKVEQQDEYIPAPAFNKFCYNVLRSITYEPIAIPLVSLFFSVPRVFREYKDVRLYINSYITNIHHFGHEKDSYDKIYKNNHFFLWLMFRCVISTTYDYTSHDQYFRFKEAALFGISYNKDLSNKKNIFKVCVDIFSILNLKQAQLLGNEKEDDVYRTYSDKIRSDKTICDKKKSNKIIYNKTTCEYPYSTIIFSDEMKEYLIKVIPNNNTTNGSTNNNNSIILDSMSLEEIYKFFRDTFQKFYNIEPINYMYIFATNNPNRRNFWKEIRKYNQLKNSNKTKLLFIKVSEYIQVRFWDLIYNDNNTKYIIILYTDDYVPNGNYIINCRDMPVNNKIGNNPDKFTFYWYDKIDGEIVKLSNKYNIDTEADADGGYIFMYEKDENLGGVYYPEFNRFHIDYKQYTFEFLNYLIEKEQSCIAGIQLEAPITATNVVSTVSDGAMKVDIYIIATKDGYTLPYKLTDCVCYLYVCDTEEIIEGTISVIRDGDEDIEFLTTFSFMPKRRYTDLVCKLSLSLKDFENIHQGDSKNCLSITLNYNNIILQYYKNQYTWNIDNLPVVYKIKQACFMSGYDFSDENNQKIQLKVKIEPKGKNISNAKVKNYIIWVGGEKNIDNDGDPSNIKILKDKDNKLLIGDEIEYILPKEWTRKVLYNNPNKYIVFFPCIIQYGKLQELESNVNDDISFWKNFYKYHTAFKTSRNKLSVEAVKLINDDKNIDKIELQAIYNYPFDKNISETKWHIMVHDATSPIYADRKTIVGHNYEMVLNNLDQVSAYNIAFDKNKFNVNMLYLLADKGEKITFSYDSMFLDKKLIFFASMRKVTSSSSASYMFTQPITLRFDGETLQIYENGNKLDGYDARSGVAEEQRKKTDGNKTEYVKEVAYPSVKSNNDDSNTVDNSSKFFYYDDSNTSKIPEGEYYIMANDIKTNPYNSTEALNTQGSKYMHIYPYYNLDFYNEELFNKTINTAHNTMEAVGHYNNFLTSYLIHGGTDYEDNYGIDLSSNITTFCNNLTTLVNDTYKDKLYKVYGKVPIKLIVEYGKYPIDLRGKSTPNGGIVEWISQFDNRPDVGMGASAGDVACYRTCVEILKRSGLGNNSGQQSDAIEIAIEKGEDLKKEGTSKIVINGKKIEGIVYSTIDGEFDTNNQESYIKVDNMKFIEGVKYIDQELEAGYPVLVGVDHHYDRRIKGGVRYNAPKYTTDHFIVIVGRDSDANGFFYRFYEVGTGKYAFQGSKVNLESLNNTYRPNGIHDDNKLYIKNNILIGKTKYKPNSSYVVTEVRRNQHK